MDNSGAEIRTVGPTPSRQTGSTETWASGRITLSGVEKRYGDVLAVDGVSAVIEDGEFFTLVGPSGCGKTTTLRTIAGLETLSAGTVGIAGRDVTDTPPNHRNVGMVFQDFALFSHMTVAENVAYGLEVEGGIDSETITERVEEMLELVELPEYGDRMPDQLSGGQQQRIALARALAKQPDVLLLDEPLASLDKQLRETMQVELRRIQREVGITTVLVTHNQKEALTMSDRIAVMKDGTFEQVGTPKEVYETPASSFVADFIGTANIFNGTVKSTSEAITTVDCGTVSIDAADATVSPGERVSVVVRPENVGISVPSETDATGTTLEGTVGITRYSGDRLEYHMTVGDGRSIIATQGSNQKMFEVEDQVVATIDPEECLVVPQ